ncbi:hypothetical protein HZC34_06795 [Candidatus Saganbacteria bacterium]|nr:hypothetical protein [Candidatus Saganbacteria bacterium]
MSYITRRKFRLLTQAEWEVAIKHKIIFPTTNKDGNSNPVGFILAED